MFLKKKRGHSTAERHQKGQDRFKKEKDALREDVELKRNKSTKTEFQFVSSTGPEGNNVQRG